MHIDLIRKLIVTECTRAKQIARSIPHYLQLQAWTVCDPHKPLTVSWLVCSLLSEVRVDVLGLVEYINCMP